MCIHFLYHKIDRTSTEHAHVHTHASIHNPQGWPDKGLGGRMLWYIVGTILAFVSFLGVFAFAPFSSGGQRHGGSGGKGGDSRSAVLYFSVMASTFNVGWAAVQVCGWTSGRL